MRISGRVCSAIYALVDLAHYGHPDKPMQLIKIAERTQLSHSYLEQIFVNLRKANLVKSHRGPGGGYTLAKGAELTTLKDIVLTLEQKSKVPDNIEELCAALDVHMINYMETITLAMVVNKNLIKGSLRNFS